MSTAPCSTPDIPTLMQMFNHSSQRQALAYLGIHPNEIRDAYLREIQGSQQAPCGSLIVLYFPFSETPPTYPKEILRNIRILYFYGHPMLDNIALLRRQAHSNEFNPGSQEVTCMLIKWGERSLSTSTISTAGQQLKWTTYGNVSPTWRFVVQIK
jgi:hypothetical protein